MLVLHGVYTWAVARVNYCKWSRFLRLPNPANPGRHIKITGNGSRRVDFSLQCRLRCSSTQVWHLSGHRHQLSLSEFAARIFQGSWRGPRGASRCARAALDSGARVNATVLSTGFIKPAVFCLPGDASCLIPEPINRFTTVIETQIGCFNPLLSSASI